MDGEPFVSRWLYQSFGRAEVADYDNVRVYSNNIEVGRTNKKGQIFISDLLPYHENILRVEEKDIPIDAQIESTTVSVIPYFRSGTTVTFSIEPLRSVFITVVREDNTYLPAGTILKQY